MIINCIVAYVFESTNLSGRTVKIMTKFKRQKKSYEDLPTLALKRGIDNNNLEVDETKDQMQSYEEYRLLALDLLKKQRLMKYITHACICCHHPIDEPYSKGIVMYEDCTSTKELLIHIKNCPGCTTFKNCNEGKELLRHKVMCVEKLCSICHSDEWKAKMGVKKRRKKRSRNKSNNSSDNLAILGTTPKVMAGSNPTTINNADGGIKRNDSLSNFANINLSSPSSPTKGNEANTVKQTTTTSISSSTSSNSSIRIGGNASIKGNNGKIIRRVVSCNKLKQKKNNIIRATNKIKSNSFDVTNSGGHEGNNMLSPSSSTTTTTTTTTMQTGGGLTIFNGIGEIQKDTNEGEEEGGPLFF